MNGCRPALRRARGEDLTREGLIPSLSKDKAPAGPRLPERAAEHWLLLTREAERGGFIGGTADGADWEALVDMTAVAIARQQVLSELGEFAEQMMANPQFAGMLLTVSTSQPSCSRPP